MSAKRETNYKMYAGEVCNLEGWGMFHALFERRV
jgi:hypothetical protein